MFLFLLFRNKLIRRNWKSLYVLILYKSKYFQNAIINSILVLNLCYIIPLPLKIFQKFDWNHLLQIFYLCILINFICCFKSLRVMTLLSISSLAVFVRRLRLIVVLSRLFSGNRKLLMLQLKLGLWLLQLLLHQ